MVDMLVPFPPYTSLTMRDWGRWWAKFKRGSPNECWLWTAHKNDKGYGHFSLQDTLYLSNRVAYFLAHKCDPGKFQACHSCDNPPCVNPSHLFLGTNQDNMADRSIKDRCNCQGEMSGSAKLRESDLPNIWRRRDWGATLLELANDYAVSQNTISNACTGESWKHMQHLRHTY